MATTELKCDKHHTPTHLTCAQCGKPACAKCLVWTEVGQKCRTCVPRKSNDERNPLLLVGGLAALLVIVLLFAFGVFSGDDGGEPVAAGNRPRVSQPGLGQPARDGAITFVVTRFDCGATEVGEGAAKRTANGRFCLLEFSATNSGNQPTSFISTQQLLLDRQRRRFAPDGAATAAYQRSTTGPISQSPVQQMNPGAEIEAVLVYDISEGINPELAELHGGNTLGVTVRLTEGAGRAAS